MAFVGTVKQIRKVRCSVHEPVECTYTVFTGDDGQKYLQLDSYGSATRKLTGKISQTLQFNKASAQELRAIIDREFGR
jgi:hypothetical protein